MSNARVLIRLSTQKKRSFFIRSRIIPPAILLRFSFTSSLQQTYARFVFVCKLWNLERKENKQNLSRSVGSQLIICIEIRLSVRAYGCQ